MGWGGVGFAGLPVRVAGIVEETWRELNKVNTVSKCIQVITKLNQKWAGYM